MIDVCNHYMIKYLDDEIGLLCANQLSFIKMLYFSDIRAVCPPDSLPLLQSMDHFDDIGPSVVMASPGMMQSGLSRELFESWCTDKRNGVIIAGYCVEGTLAKVEEGKMIRMKTLM